MARGVRGGKPSQAAQSTLFDDEMPEHAKMYPYLEGNWAIRHFLNFLALQGLAEFDHDRVEDLLLEFRGVDVRAYKAESDILRARYDFLWKKYALPEDIAKVPVKPIVRVPSLEPEVAQPAPPALSRAGEEALSVLLSKIKKVEE